MNIQNLTGQVLGQYELEALLGYGGMGVVYRAIQRNLERQVAVKVLSAGLANERGYLERFYQEAKTAAALEHSNIGPVYDYGVQGDISYVVMRYLTGGTLADRIAQRAESDTPLPSLGEVTRLLEQLASALDYAHSRGVIHRDIKPSNIMFDDQGTAYIVDFGIAKLLESTSSYTASNTPIGTPIYMPPEQWRSEKLTPAADQYALAITVYSLLSGRAPFDATSPYAMLHAHLNEDPLPIREVRADVPPGLTSVIDRALEKEPGDRWPSCGAFSDAFGEAVSGQTGEMTNFFTTPILIKTRPATTLSPGGTGTAPPAGSAAGGDLVTFPTETIRPVYKYPVTWVLVVALLIALGGIGVLLLGQAGDSDSPSEAVSSDFDATEEFYRAQLESADETRVALLATSTVVTATAAAADTATSRAPSLTPTEPDEPTETAISDDDAATATQAIRDQTATQATANEAEAQAAAASTATQSALEDEATAFVAASTATQAAQDDAATAEVVAQTATRAAARGLTATAEAEQATATERARPTQTPTPRPSATPAPSSTPTPVPPDIRVVYDDERMTVLNMADRFISIGGWLFGDMLADPRAFEARQWGGAGGSVTTLAPGECLQLLASDANIGPEVVEGCDPKRFFATRNVFWAGENDSFVIYRLGATEPYATCLVADGACGVLVEE